MKTSSFALLLALWGLPLTTSQADNATATNETMSVTASSTSTVNETVTTLASSASGDSTDTTVSTSNSTSFEAAFGDHCEQDSDDLKYLISIQELQSPTGPRHSDAIQNTGGDSDLGTGLGFVWFDNEIVQPLFGASMGDQTGHCIQVSFEEDGGKLACYFNFNIQEEDDGCSGRITAEALFDLSAFPNANLVITGGTGDFHGIRGNGCTQAVEDAPEDVATFIYNFSYDLSDVSRRSTCHSPAKEQGSRGYNYFRGGKTSDSED